MSLVNVLVVGLVNVLVVGLVDVLVVGLVHLRPFLGCWRSGGIGASSRSVCGQPTILLQVLLVCDRPGCVQSSLWLS